MTLPRPPWTIDLPVTIDAEPDLAALPARPGVMSFRDEADRTLTLLTGADLRRLARSRLDATDGDRGRRIDYRSLTRRLVAMTVGSAFEADWAWLQIARDEMPSTYASSLDRNPHWWIRADPNVEHPRWSRIDRPSPAAIDDGSAVVGPMPTRQAATRCIEMLEDAFDLCRYHEVLLQTPHGQACMYKEMGRCDAPCDGSVPMSVYRTRFNDSVQFTADPTGRRADAERRMIEAGARLEFENAERVRLHLERTAPLSHRDLMHARRLDAFRFLSVQRSDRRGWSRLLVIVGGWIAPVIDVHVESATSKTLVAIRPLIERALERPLELGEAALANLGLVCRHLFRPPSRYGSMIRLVDARDGDVVVRAIKRTQPSGGVDDAGSGPDEFDQR